jgi:hypothetical protein
VKFKRDGEASRQTGRRGEREREREDVRSEDELKPIRSAHDGKEIGEGHHCKIGHITSATLSLFLHFSLSRIAMKRWEVRSTTGRFKKATYMSTPQNKPPHPRRRSELEDFEYQNVDVFRGRCRWT